MIHQLVVEYRHWRYKNLFFLALSIGIFILVVRNPFFAVVLESLSKVPYLGAFVAGIFCASTFTVVPALILLLKLGQHFNPLEVALLAGIGCTIGDFLTMRFIKDQIFEELSPIFDHFKPHRILYLFHTPYFAWLLPIIGAVLIASPGPDEVGLALLGVKELKDWEMLTLLFVINSIGMVTVLGIASIVVGIS